MTYFCYVVICNYIVFTTERLFVISWRLLWPYSKCVAKLHWSSYMIYFCCLHVCFLLYVACTVYGQCVIVYVSDFFTYKIIDIKYTDIYLQLYGKLHKNCNIFAISLERNTKDNRLSKALSSDKASTMARASRPFGRIMTSPGREVEGETAPRAAN